MKVLVLTGPPGVGKGTQASLLKERIGALHISTGAVLRSEVESRSSLGRQVEATMAAGDLVEDEIIFMCLQRALVSGKGAPRGGGIVVLDGVPRNLRQVGMLDDALGEVGLRVDLAIALVAQVEELVSRLSRRWSCSACASVFSLEDAPASDLRCPTCGALGAVKRRADDEPDSIRHRFMVYDASTAPVLSAFASRGLLKQINGLASQEEVFAELKEAVDRIL